MFVLGHVGITVGITFLLHQRYFRELALDYRIIVVLSLLPDIIDKTLGHVIFHGTLDYGRLVAHTLLFSLILTLFFYKISKARWQLLSLPIWLHLLLDRMLEDGYMLFWPLLGWEFRSKDWNILETWEDALFHDPYTVGGELVGGCTILLLVWRCGLYKRRELVRFLRTGHVGKR